MNDYITEYRTEQDYNAALEAHKLPLPHLCYITNTGKVMQGIRHAVDRYTNAPLMDLCVDMGWARESNDYLTFEEAADVKFFGGDTYKDYGITSLWELKYFTGVSFTPSNNAIKSLPNIDSVYIPDHVTYAVGVNGAKKVHISDSMTQMYSYFSRAYNTVTLGDGSTLYLGKSLTKLGTADYFNNYDHVIVGKDDDVYPFNNQFLDNFKYGTLWVPDSQLDKWLAKTDAWARFKTAGKGIRPMSEYDGDPDF